MLITLHTTAAASLDLEVPGEVPIQEWLPAALATVLPNPRIDTLRLFLQATDMPNMPGVDEAIVHANQVVSMKRLKLDRSLADQEVYDGMQLVLM